MAEHFDLMPNQVLRVDQFGQKEFILNSKTVWLCAACEACSTRCRQGIDITRVMDVLKIMAQRANGADVLQIGTAEDQALRTGVRSGADAELYPRRLLAGELDIGRFFLSDLPLAMKMVRRGKLRLLPTRPSDQPTKGVAYYPGCSLHSTAIKYNLSTKAVAERLVLSAAEGVNLDLAEPKGWASCGTTPAHSTDDLLATIMPLKNLKLIEESGYSCVAMPCPSCFIRHRTAIYDVRDDPGLRRQVAALRPFGRAQGRLRSGQARMRQMPSEEIEVEHLLTTITEQVGYDAMAEAVTQPLTGLKVVCHYGCVIPRPPKITGAENYEYPINMDRLVETLGAESLDWSYKTECCGVSLSITQLPIALSMSRRILRNAEEVGAEAIVVACPLCHANLDMRQEQINEQFGPSTGPWSFGTVPYGPVRCPGTKGSGHREDYRIPILYFTQLVGLAFGIEPRKLGMDKHLARTFPLLQAKRLIAAS